MTDTNQDSTRTITLTVYINDAPEPEYANPDRTFTDDTEDLSAPWLNEPDRTYFYAAGYLCEIRRNPNSGALCGYVTVPPEHPLHGVHYDEAPYISVHGGLTYSGGGGDDCAWVFGFDCAHWGDMCPKMPQLSHEGAEYRTMGYVTDECVSLAYQLHKLRNWEPGQ